MYVLTPKEMDDLDRASSAVLGIERLLLMENAGKSVYEILKEEFPLFNNRVVVVAGKGNNGGDGFVAARYLAEMAGELQVYVFADISEIKGLSKKNLDILEKMGVEVVEVKEKIPEEVAQGISEADIIVDALFGTGFRGEAKGIYGEVINLVNQSDGFVISIDIPSGVNGETGEVKGEAILADLTVAMGFPKLGHYLYPGASYVGELVVAEIGIPQMLAEDRIKRKTIDPIEMLLFLPKRKGPEHKGEFGRVLVISGSTGFTGAATLVSLSALRVGAGLVYLAIPESLNPILEVKATEVITIPVKERNGVVTPEGVEQIFQKNFSFDVCAIGPGLTRTETALRALLKTMEIFRGPIIIDADGVVLLRNDLGVLKERKSPTILTPHPGEMGLLIGSNPSEINRKRIETVETFADEYDVILILKGAPTVLRDPFEKMTYINTTGNPGLATAGTGDVLTGMIAGFLAQGIEPVLAAQMGIFYHGLAGDIAASDLGEASLIASDLLNYIPKALTFFLEKKEE